MTKKKIEKAESFKMIGVSGRQHFSGYINEEFLTELKGTRGMKVYREMRDNDPVIGAILFAIEMLLRQVEWRVEGETLSSEDQLAAQFIEECLKDMKTKWSDQVSEVLTMLPFGWALQEVSYKRRNGAKQDERQSSRFSDGKIGWGAIELRAQETLQNWKIEDDGTVSSMTQLAPPRYQATEIPLSKCLLFRTTKNKNNPEGRSVLRNAYRPWYFKKRIEEVEGIGTERDLAGLPVIYAPARIMDANASASDKAIFAELKKIVTGIRRDEQEGVIMPGNRDENGNLLYELKLLSTGGTRQFNTNEIINRWDQRIAMTVLGDFVLLGHEKVGSFALSSDKTDLFARALGAWLGSIGETRTTEANKLLSLNGMDGRVKMVHEDIETPNLTEVGDYITKLSGAGVPLFPDPKLEGYLRRVASLPGGEEQSGQKKSKKVLLKPKEKKEELNGGDP